MGMSQRGKSDSAESSGPRRFAYADPPYPRQAKRHYGRHPDYAGEVDHRELVGRLEAEFPDGWALSTSSTALAEVLELCPKPEPHPKGGRYRPGTGVRVMAWCKPMHQILPLSVQYAWEPVIVRGGRQRRGRVPQVVDYLIASPTPWHAKRRARGSITGTKPPEFCHWLFEVLGALPGDELVDLFPGSGAVGRAWREWSAAGPEPWEQATLAVAG